MRRAITAVLFDLDGTLIDSAPDLGAAAEKMRTERGLAPLGLTAYRTMAGAGARGMLEVAFGLGSQHPAYEAMKNEFLGNYQAAMMVHSQIFPGVADLIDALNRSAMPWGIVTNKAERFTLPLVRGIPLFSAASVVVGGDTTPYAKPHPEPLFEACRRMALNAAECVYVGDDERDIVAGRAAGMATVAAKYGYLGAKCDTAAWASDHIIARPMDLLPCLGL